MEKTAQGQSDFHPVDPARARSRYASAEDVDGQRDDDAVVTRERFHGLAEVTRLDPHHVLRIHAVGMRWPVAVAR